MAVSPTAPGVTVSAMYEFDSVSVSSYEAASLAAKLAEKSADGWEVVAVVPAGNEVVAYLKRTASDTEEQTNTAVAADPAPVSTAAATTAAASEPAGWGSAPASSDTGSSWGGSSSNDSGSSWGTAAAATTPSAPSQPAQPATPSVPAGWYHDPAGRYELRYWDGSAWTEHVSRAGQQYTDPPVA
jgi:hypothetical protein